MLKCQFARLFANESGATAIEYGLIAALIAVAAIASFTVLGNSLVNLFGAGVGGAANVIGEAAGGIGG